MAKDVILNVGSFDGLDQRAGCSTGIQKLPHLVNFRVDESGALEKRNGYGVVDTIEQGQEISAVYRGVLDGEEITLAACNGGMYALGKDDVGFKFIGQTQYTSCTFFEFGNKVYCLGGDLFRCYGNKIERVEGYAPLVLTACTPSGVGTVYEQPNMLSGRRRVRFNADGASISYSLPEKNVTSIVSAKVNEEEIPSTGYTLIADMGVVEFTDVPPEGINNVEICYSVETNHGIKSIITGCKYGVVFESRLFLFGNPYYPDRIYHSELADGIPSVEYFTEFGYHAAEKEVTALIPCYNRLLIFFEDSACFTYAELKTDTMGNVFTSFPVYELHSSKGCTVKGVGCSFDNTPVTLCRDGLNKWVSTAIADERSAENFSHRVFKFINEATANPKGLYLFNRKALSELWLCTNIGTLIYNYKSDCFYLYDIRGIRSIHEDGREIWMGMADGRVCIFSEDCYLDGDEPIKAEFETPFCSFGSPFELKSLTGLCLGLLGKNAIEADISFIKGNGTETLSSAERLSLKSCNDGGYRRLKSRLHLKRFFSCKMRFSSTSYPVKVKDITLFSKQLKGAIRIN